MQTREQRFIRPDGSDFYIMHLYSEAGHLVRDGHATGTHVELGTHDSAANYTDHDDGTPHDVPESLPDVILPDDPGEDPAEVADYQAALEELGVQINEEA